MSEAEHQFDYPVQIDDAHVAIDSCDYAGDRFECTAKSEKAYTHTGGWPAWNHCPFCGAGLDV